MEDISFREMIDARDAAGLEDFADIGATPEGLASLVWIESRRRGLGLTYDEVLDQPFQATLSAVVEEPEEVSADEEEDLESLDPQSGDDA